MVANQAEENLLDSGSVREETRRPGGSQFRLACACSRLRRASRAVTRLYNRELQVDGVEMTQFTLLMALDQAGEIAQGELGKWLALDSTTLTRMLGLLEQRAWVKARIGEDRRQHFWSLTEAGRDRFEQSRRRWQHAQERLRAALGEPIWEQMSRVLAEITKRSAGANFFEAVIDVYASIFGTKGTTYGASG